MGMVMSMAPMASAAYYLTQQCSYRHPNEYYSGGREPDGVWFNRPGCSAPRPRQDRQPGLSQALRRLLAARWVGAHPLGGQPQPLARARLHIQRDKSVSVLWAIADPQTRAVIEELVNEAARFAIEQTMVRWCSTTRVRRADAEKGEPGEIEVVPASLIGVQFQHGESREGDPQLHIHFLVLNVAKTREDGKYRAVNMHPMYKWQKASGAAFGAYVAGEMGKRLGVRFEHYGENNEFLRVAGIPESQAEGWSRLLESWSTRTAEILAMAREMGPGGRAQRGADAED